jgi:hypothetical protein
MGGCDRINGIDDGRCKQEEVVVRAAAVMTGRRTVAMCVEP